MVGLSHRRGREDALNEQGTQLWYMVDDTDFVEEKRE